MPLSQPESKQLARLERLVVHARNRGLRSLGPEALSELPRLYRQACTVLARLQTSGADQEATATVRRVVNAAHGLMHREPRAGVASVVRRTARFFLEECPRAMRAEWKLICVVLAGVYGLAIASYVAVSRDLDLAFSLLHADFVKAEIEQLEQTAPGEPFRGNFTFGIGESPSTAGKLMAHNMGVGVLMFAAALIPPLYAYIMGTNGLMLGTYTGVAWHWGQAGAISSVLWCHGVLEIQALVLAGAAGLVLVRAWVAPGPWTRTHAMKLEARRAGRLLAPVFPMLFCAGLIEGFVSPHAELGTRLLFAVASGLALLAWGLGGGRRPSNLHAGGAASASALVEPRREQRPGGLRRHRVEHAHAAPRESA